MDDKLMHIPNDEKQNYPLSRLKLYWLKSLKPTNENSTKVPKVFEPTNKKTLGTSVIYSPLSSP